MDPSLSSFRAISRLKVGLLGFAALVAIPVNGIAELIYFRGGGGVQIPARTNGDQVILKLSTGDATFHREDFRAIAAGFSPEIEWPKRLESTRGKEASMRFATAWWALENGLVHEAVSEFQSIHRDDPKHPPCARIVAALNRLKPALNDPEDLPGFEAALGVPMTRAMGPHILLLHQHGDAEAQERIELLERVVSAYYVLLAGQGIELPAPRHRLVMAWLGDRADYLAFLHAEKADAFKTTRGYYHPTRNAVITYDERIADRQRNAHQMLEIRRMKRVGSFRTSRLNETQARLAELQLEFDRQAYELGTLTHELIHSLVANSGLLPHHDAFPIWMHEGFSAQFEVIRGGRWMGISRANDLRLPDWRKIYPAPRLEPLIRDAGYGKGYQRDLYVQAWALVYFLRIRHPEQFLTFLDLLRTPGTIGLGADEPDTGPPLPAGQRATLAFHRAFGDDLASLEREWHAFLNSVQTPLDRYNPELKSRSQQ